MRQQDGGATSARDSLRDDMEFQSGERDDSGVLEGDGVVSFYNNQRFNPNTRKFGWYGFIHRHDVECNVFAGSCRHPDHRIYFTIDVAKYLPEEPRRGMEVHFKAEESEFGSLSATRIYMQRRR